MPDQVVLEFPAPFWTDSADFFGAALPGGPELRGDCFMFWNLQRFSGRPILAALVSGAAATVCGFPNCLSMAVTPEEEGSPEAVLKTILHL